MLRDGFYRGLLIGALCHYAGVCDKSRASEVVSAGDPRAWTLQALQKRGRTRTRSQPERDAAVRPTSGRERRVLAKVVSVNSQPQRRFCGNMILIASRLRLTLTWSICSVLVADVSLEDMNTVAL
jgi:hypothetical protein